MKRGTAISVWICMTWCLACASHRPPAPLPDAGLVNGASGGSGTSGSAGQLGSAGSTAGQGAAGAAGSTSKAACGGSCQCSDGIDNDGDGQIDGFDTECTGPNDNDEGSFSTGIPGDNVDPKWQDCFFDGNSGGGDDGCRYSTDCLTGKLSQSDAKCAVTQQCLTFCKPLVPNGCDCFGCCAIRKPDGSTVQIVTNSSCDLAHIDKCQTCVPATQCGNTCGDCELCPGKTAADLPAKCNGTAGAGGGAAGGGGTTGTAGSGGSSPPPYICDNGLSVCKTTGDCAGGHYCSFGCCLTTPPG